MSLVAVYQIVCDNCGEGEDCDLDDDSATLSDGWEEDYDDGDAIWDHVCSECVKEFKEIKEKDNG